MSSNKSSIIADRSVPPISGVSANVCLAFSKLFLNKGPLKRFGFRKAEITRFDSMDDWIADRVEQIDEHHDLFKPFVSFAGKTVFELGCNRGYMMNSFLEREKFEAIGGDIDADALETARAKFGDRIKFVQTTADSIPLPDQSVDVIYTIDTVEHLIELDKIFAECYRILKPGGTMLVHFGAWYGPYGTHLEDIIPFPWANVVFSMDTLLKVAAHLYDSPDYSVACYFLDEKTGKPKPNPYLDKSKWDNFLNRITIRRFRRVIRDSQFETVHLENIGFGGKTFKVGRSLAKLSQLPVTEELFTKATFAVLKK